MARVIAALVMVLVAWLAHLCSLAYGDSYVRNACSVTQYPDLCMHSLSSFSSTAKDSPTKWARAGVSVTINEAKRVARYLVKLKKGGTITGGRNRGALSDCIECLQDTVDNLHRSLGVLRKLNGQTFGSQMGDVTTWVSAALTDEDTCLDGFDGQRGKKANLVRNRVSKISCITSNALALVNKLATSGPETLDN
ncbi:pectinesterase inhibitor 6 [Cornus florida]|uniref:pectinesterase inhibitor 6 n=1 Tax=Cornus florida TaxID=4283 RepID=UPI00289C0CD6|nr:pectinesterase inhibitor 6 [Cornus florida]